MTAPSLSRHPVCHRLFLAIVPPPPLARQIAQAALWYGPEGRGARADRMHVTIDILDDFEDRPAHAIDTLCAVMGSVAAAAVAIELDQAVGSTRSVALRARRRNPALDRFHRAVGAARARTGLPQRAGYRFSPHLTLFYRDGAPFSRAIAPIRWVADEFVLVHSLVGRTQHEILGRWPLQGEDDGQYRLL